MKWTSWNEQCIIGDAARNSGKLLRMEAAYAVRQRVNQGISVSIISLKPLVFRWDTLRFN